MRAAVLRHAVAAAAAATTGVNRLGSQCLQVDGHGRSGSKRSGGFGAARKQAKGAAASSKSSGDGKQTVEQLVKAEGAVVHGFVLYVVGEGIEKRKDDFAAEVAAMAKA